MERGGDGEIPPKTLCLIGNPERLIVKPEKKCLNKITFLSTFLQPFLLTNIVLQTKWVRKNIPQFITFRDIFIQCAVGITRPA